MRILLLLAVLAVGASAETLAPTRWQLGELGRRTATGAAADVPADSRIDDLVQGLDPALELARGVHRVSATVRVAPADTFGYRVVLTARFAEKTPTLPGVAYRHDFGKLTPRPRELWLAVATARPCQADADGVLQLTADFALAEPAAVQVAVGWSIGEYHARQLRPEQMPAAIDRLELTELTIQPLPQSAWIEELRTDKLVYKPGTVPHISADVRNFAAAPVRWRLRLTRDLEPPREVAAGTGEVAADLPADLPFGGYRVDLDLLAGEEVVAHTERCFAVSPSYNRIGMYGVGLETNPQPSISNIPEKIDYAMDWMQKSYLGWYEIGFWAPDDFQGLAPADQDFVSNLYTPQKRDMIQYMCAAGAKRGIGVYAYAKGSYADGAAGWDWAQRHPELLLYDADSGEPLGRYDMERFVNQKQFEADVLARKPVSVEWFYVLLNPARPGIVDAAAHAMLESVAMFGWAGVRFDGDFANLGLGDAEGRGNGFAGHPYAEESETEATWAACLNRYRRLVNARYPDFEIGCNYGFLDDKGCLTAVGAMARNDGLVMNEAIRGHQHPQHPQNRWDDYAEVIVRDARRVRQMGGWYQTIGAYAMRAEDYLYQSVYTLAAQAKPYGPYFFSTPFSNRLPRYITRFAGVFCGEQYPVPGARNKVAVTGSAPLEWERYVNFLQHDATHRRYVIQLINPPANERAMGEHERTEMRPPVRDVGVTLRLDPGERIAAAWQLDPWLADDALPAAVDGTTVALPREIAVWSTLVIDCTIDMEAF